MMDPERGQGRPAAHADNSRAERPDLNLFRVFDAVMQHRNLTRAGRDLGVTVSAVSHALTRLRTMLGDELFVTGVRGTSPTARAVELAPMVTAALAAFGDVLAARPFDPATAERVFRIGCSDHTGPLFLPGLLGRVLRDAPRVCLRVLPLGRTDLIEQLDEGRLDLVVSWFGSTPERIRRRDLFKEYEAIVVRAGHPLAGRRSDKAELLRFPHVVVELTGGGEATPGGFFDERGFHRRVWLERLLLESAEYEPAERRTATVTVPSFGFVAPLLRGPTNLVATLPLRLAQEACASGDLVTLDLPYERLELMTEAAWHERADRDPALMWLVRQLEAVCAVLVDLPDRPPKSGLP